MRVKIEIYQSELESVLDRIQAWGENYNWYDTGPNFQIELQVRPAYYDRMIKDRFVDPEYKNETIENIVSKYTNTRPSAHEQMEQLRQLLRGE